MKKIGILGAMYLELETIHNKMKLSRDIEINGFHFIEGEIYNKKIVICTCGIGKVNAASCTQVLIDKFDVDYIINTGVAGGLKSDVNICDVVISKDVTHHDVSKAQMISYFPNKEYFEADEELIELARKACELTSNTEYHIGRIVSGDSFISNMDVKEQIIKDYDPHCVEMEGSAIGHVAYINKVGFVVIRSISDKADNHAYKSYDSFEIPAAEKAANVILNMIKIMDY